MAGRNKIKRPDAKTIYNFVQKLKTTGDITVEEADQVFSLFSANSVKTRLNPNSYKAEYDLMDALTHWYQVVTQKIKQGQRGNFIFTIVMPSKLPLSQGGFHDFIRNAQEDAEESLRQHGTPEDFFIRLLVDRKVYSLLPPEFQRLFTEVTFYSQPFYILNSPRAGMYYYPIKTKTGIYTVAQFIEGFSPIMKIHHYSRSNSFFEVASGVYELTQNSQLLKATLNGNMVAQYVIAAYMKHKNIPCITMVEHSSPNSPHFFDEDVVIFTEKDRAQIMQNALRENVIDKKIAKNLINNGCVDNLPVEFIETSIKYIDNIIQRKLKWEATQDTVEKENTWLDIVR